MRRHALSKVMGPCGWRWRMGAGGVAAGLHGRGYAGQCAVLHSRSWSSIAGRARRRQRRCVSWRWHGVGSTQRSKPAWVTTRLRVFKCPPPFPRLPPHRHRGVRPVAAGPAGSPGACRTAAQPAAGGGASGGGCRHDAASDGAIMAPEAHRGGWGRVAGHLVRVADRADCVWTGLACQH